MLSNANSRQEYDVREERRRELEFLEKVHCIVILLVLHNFFPLFIHLMLQGGNPLDFKLGHVASLSVQSTSVTDQIAEQNVIR
jgi:hypothetical protein